MAIIDKSMGALDPNDVAGAMKTMENYIAYLQESFEQYSYVMGLSITKLETRIAELEGTT